MGYSTRARQFRIEIKCLKDGNGYEYVCQVYRQKWVEGHWMSRLVDHGVGQMGVTRGVQRGREWPEEAYGRTGEEDLLTDLFFAFYRP